MDDTPLYKIAAELIKHLKNRNYGLAEQIALELWSRLAGQHDNQEDDQEV
ncbi:MAG: hypothetical protein ACXAC5_00980 [Promethearchaeota archaeon]|jgi:hypothetical protein